MDPFHGSNQPFLNLLNSQEIPPFPNSQINLSQINFSQESHRTLPIPNHNEKRRLWSHTEDVILCSAWLNTSKDVIVSNEQRNSTFWDCVAAYFNACPEIKDGESRVGATCKARWSKINEAVSKFVGAYEAATRNKKSGENDDNIMSNALKIYSQDNKKPFTLKHAWLELRHDQKWCSTLAGNVSGSRKRKMVDDHEATSTPVDDGPEKRPIGVKASKRKTKKKRTENSESDYTQNALETYKAMWSLKEKEVSLKKQCAKTTMLDTLLAKSTLTDLEMKLKDKLILEMLDE